MTKILFICMVKCVFFSKNVLKSRFWECKFEKKSEQTARNLLNDFEATKTSLSNVAGSLKLCDNPQLRELGYRRIKFLSHRYFMLYRMFWTLREQFTNNLLKQ